MAASSSVGLAPPAPAASRGKWRVATLNLGALNTNACTGRSSKQFRTHLMQAVEKFAERTVDIIGFQELNEEHGKFLEKQAPSYNYKLAGYGDLHNGCWLMWHTGRVQVKEDAKSVRIFNTSRHPRRHWRQGTKVLQNQQ